MKFPAFATFLMSAAALVRIPSSFVSAQEEDNWSFLSRGFPDDWETMEVEAKWTTTVGTFERIIGEMSECGNRTNMFGYDLAVRWGGIPRKFVDYYYDTDRGTLTTNSHALRHRTRYTSKAKDRTLSTLINEDWKKDWERIQYKSTPTRVGAVWFRREIGDCLIWDDSKKTVLCEGIERKDDADEIIPNATMVHPALTFMQEDHPEVDRATLRPTLAVTDFRYRIEFSLNGEPVLEVSLDELISENLETGKTKGEFEVELEIIADAPADTNLRELFRVANLMEERFELSPSGRSKGGNRVPDSSPEASRRTLGGGEFGSGREFGYSSNTAPGVGYQQVVYVQQLPQDPPLLRGGGCQPAGGTAEVSDEGETTTASSKEADSDDDEGDAPQGRGRPGHPWPPVRRQLRAAA